MMMAAYRRRREALQRAAHLLTDVMLSGDRDAVRAIVMYLWATQDRATARRFGRSSLVGKFLQRLIKSPIAVT